MPIRTAIGIGLSVIPPASRRPGAARVRMGGSSARPPARAVTDESEFKPQVIAPDAQVQRQRQAYQKAMAAKAKQLEALIAQAEEAGGEDEAAHWREELARLAPN